VSREISSERGSSLADIADSFVTALELYKSLREMNRMALTDPLTELPNRRRFFNVLNARSSDASCTGRPCSLLSLDCHEFKSLNDTHGHEAGDSLVREMSSALQEALCGPDLVARLGGTSLPPFFRNWVRAPVFWQQTVCWALATC
jgi:PleD family two-component response regulator